MKRYIKADTSKPELNHIEIEWEEIDNGNGIMFTVYSDSGEVLFQEIFDYGEVDSDAIYGSAVDLAYIALSRKYELSDEVVKELKGEDYVDN